MHFIKTVQTGYHQGANTVHIPHKHLTCMSQTVCTYVIASQTRGGKIYHSNSQPELKLQCHLVSEYDIKCITLYFCCLSHPQDHIRYITKITTYRRSVYVHNVLLASQYTSVRRVTRWTNRSKEFICSQ